MPTAPTRRVATGVALTVAAAAAGAAFGAAPAAAAPTEAAPKNVIVLIGDGMGYNHVDLVNAVDRGVTHHQVQTGADGAVSPAASNAPRPTEGFQSWDQVGMATFQDGSGYDSAAAWGDVEWVMDDPTDSAAAGTALAAGVKTYNAGIGVDPAQTPVENIAERAKALGKSAGVVSDVPFSHATPAAYSAHNTDRNDYHGIASEQVNGDLDVVIGAGHPHFDDNNERLAEPDFGYIAEEDFETLSSGGSDFTFLEDTADFQALTSGETPERVFGIPQVGSTLQQSRTPEDGPFNEGVPSLATLATGALNVLDNTDEGLFLMVEGGAIDWTGHANDTQRTIEEVRSFNDAIDATVDWVETNSSWDETLVVVTADHETGYLNGPDEASFNPMIAGAPGTIPTLSWNSGQHTNQLVPFFYRGAGAGALTAAATGEDLVRGAYLDNTDMARWLLDSAWVAEEPAPEPNPEPSPEPEPSPAPEPAPEPTDPAPGEPGDDAGAGEPGSGDAAGSEQPAAAGDRSPAKVTATRSGDLADTGADSMLPLAIGAAALVAAGAGATVVAARRRAAARR